MKAALFGCLITLAMASAAYADISSQFKEWLYDKPGSIYEEVYVDDDTTLIVTIVDCDKSLHWIVGGKLNANEAAKFNVYEYTYIYSPEARLTEWIREHVMKELGSTVYLSRNTPGCVV